MQWLAAMVGCMGELVIAAVVVSAKLMKAVLVEVAIVAAQDKEEQRWQLQCIICLA